MTTIAEVLAQHVDRPHDPRGRHQLVLLDAARLRCLDCLRTIDLRSLTAPSQTTSTSPSPPPLHASDRCRVHPGETQGRCGRCRAEQLERIAEGNPFTPSADVKAGVAAARAALARRREAVDVDV